jgi:hypothetical protein
MVVPTVMKKGRAGLWLVVVAEPAAAGALAERVLRETTSLGVRVRMDERWELPRRLAEVSTPYGSIALKVASLPDGGERDAGVRIGAIRGGALRSHAARGVGGGAGGLAGARRRATLKC